MMEWTDRHERYFLRLLSARAFLYTEMITTGAIIHGDRSRLLDFDRFEQPVGLQLGGSDPADLATSARIGAQWGYDEINLNVGCPSDRVQSGRFGACLMAEPQLVAECVQAMIEATDRPVTVKCRIGIDEQVPEEVLPAFAERVSNAGCRTLIVHARKALLSGLSPKENRDVPPLNYELVYQLKRDHPSLEIILNGGLTDVGEAKSHLEHLDGVMFGRAAYHNPYILSQVDEWYYDSEKGCATRHHIIEKYVPYVNRHLGEGVPLHAMTRHILGLFNGQPGARLWRRHISENAYKKGAGVEVLQAALAHVPRARFETAETTNPQQVSA